MKSTNSYFLPLGIFCLIWITNLSAQTPESSHLFLFEDCRAHPNEVTVWEKGVTDFLVHYNIQKYPYSFSAFSTDDYHYYWFFPIKNFADIDHFYDETNSLGESINPDSMASINQKLWVGYEYCDWGIYKKDPSLLYNPSTEYIHNIKYEYYYWDFVGIYPNMQTNFKTVIQEIISYLESKEIKTSFEVYFGDLGTRKPMCLIVRGTNDPLKFKNLSDYISNLIGLDNIPLTDRFNSCLRSIRSKSGKYRKDLSYKAE